MDVPGSAIRFVRNVSAVDHRSDTNILGFPEQSDWDRLVAGISVCTIRI